MLAFYKRVLAAELPLWEQGQQTSLLVGQIQPAACSCK